MLEILGERARTVPWDSRQREQWKARFEAAKAVAGSTDALAFKMSRTQPTMGLPPDCHRCRSSFFLSFLSGDRQRAEDSGDGWKNSASTRRGHRCSGTRVLVVEDPRMSDEQVLQEAVALSSDASYRQKRANYWRWQREFLNYEVFADERALKAAIEDMHDLIDDQNAAIKLEKARRVAKYVFLLGTITLGLFSGSMIPIAISPVALTLDRAFLSIGQFVADRTLEDKTTDERKAAAVFCDFDRQFGWK